jgi:tRNA(adenine34) deaminase
VARAVSQRDDCPEQRREAAINVEAIEPVRCWTHLVTPCQLVQEMAEEGFRGPADEGHGLMMSAALEQARCARDASEVPVGAVVVVGGNIIGRGYNQPISASDPTAHAEIVAIRDAARRSGNYRLPGAALYVTVEPCLMCVGAIIHARIATLVFGAAEPRSGAVVSTVRGGDLPGHNHRFEVVSGLRESECRELMQEFFKLRR